MFVLNNPSQVPSDLIKVPLEVMKKTMIKDIPSAYVALIFLKLSKRVSIFARKSAGFSFKKKSKLNQANILVKK